METGGEAMPKPVPPPVLDNTKKKCSRNNASILNFNIYSGGKGNLVGTLGWPISQ